MLSIGSPNYFQPSMGFMSTLMERMQEMEVHQRGWRASLARYCGVKPPSVSDWFTGKTVSLNAETVIKAAEFFGVRPYWLLTGKGPKYPEAKDWPFSLELLTTVKQLPGPELLKAENVLRAVVGLDMLATQESRAA